MKKLLVALLLVIAGIFYFVFDHKIAEKQDMSTVNHAAQAKQEKNITYLFGYNGDYLKIDLNAKSIMKEGNLTELNGVKEYLPAYNNIGPLIFKTRYDVTTNRIYLLTPHEIDLTSSVTPDKRKYQILTIQLPNFTVSEQLVVKRKLGYPPSFLITPDGKQLLVHYKEYSGERKNMRVTSTLQFYDTNSMKRIDETKETANAQDVAMSKAYLNNAFGIDAEFQLKGQIISDSIDTILVNIDERNMQKYPIISYDNFMSRYLTKSQRKKLNKYAVLNERIGKAYPMMAGIGEHGNTMVRIIYKDKLPEGTLIISDRKTMKSKLYRYTLNPSLAQMRLTPDGKYILTESSELRKRDDGYGNMRAQVFRTGDIFIYSAKDGRLINKISNSPLKGFDTKHICTLKDAKQTTLYQAKDKIYLLEVVGGNTLHEIKGVSGVDIGGLSCM